MWRTLSASSVGASAALRGSLWASLVATVMAPVAAIGQQTSNPAADSNAAALPEIRVIATTPVAPPRPAAKPSAATAAPAQSTAAPTQSTATRAEPGVIDRDKVPSNVQTLSAPDFDHAKAPNLLDSLERGLPGVSLGDQTGNQFQHDLNYRGFIASPVIGTPQGLAVYQNGVRINEVFGDIVNWDFIPQNAINQLTLVPSNPIYGLNAIGGALSFEMKNGYTYHGVEGEVMAGAFGRAGASVQAGGQVGNLSGYITADAIDDAGWRQDSPSQLRRIYADLGARGDQTEFHVTFTGATNNFGAAAATPVQMLNQDWTSVYTLPQTTRQSARLPHRERKLEADRHAGPIRPMPIIGHSGRATSMATAPTRRIPAAPIRPCSCFPNLNGSLSNLITTTGQTVPATGAAWHERVGRDRSHLDRDQFVRRLRSRRRLRKGYSATTTILSPG